MDHYLYLYLQLTWGDVGAQPVARHHHVSREGRVKRLTRAATKLSTIYRYPDYLFLIFRYLDLDYLEC